MSTQSEPPTAASPAPEAPALSFFATVTIHVAEPLELGRMSVGSRRIIPIVGGEFRGPTVSGRVLAGGADFQTVRSATTAVLEARYALETDEGERIAVDNLGIRNGSAEDVAALVEGRPVPPERLYFRSVPQLQGSGRWSWLEDRMFLGAGRRYPDRVELDVFLVE